jgi:LuxR family maltose regulon positive regulatory protein
MGKHFSLRGKTARPEFSRVYPRTLLFEQFDEALEQPMLWIAAPAGAGKTVAVSSYLAARELPVLWYLVDPRDEDPAHFFLSLAKAAQALAPEEALSLPLLTPEYLSHLEVFTRNFFEALFRRLLRSALLVLDNYQEVQGTVLHEVLRSAAELVPADTTLVVISRKDPPAPFTRLRVHGSMTCIGWDHLRLSLAEAQGLADLRRGEPVPPEFVAHCHERSQGWTAGLVLLLDHAGAVTDDDGAAGDPGTQLLFDYFAEEIFGRLPAPTQTVLLQTALLPYITPLLAERLTGSVEVAGILDSLHKNSFFVARRPGTESAYELHPLFHEFLVTRAQRTLNLEELMRLQVRAAEIMLDAGRPEEAVPFYLALDDWSALAKTLLPLAPEMLMQGRHQTLLAWLQAVPDAVIQQDAWLLYYLGNALLPSDPAAARGFCEQAYGLFDDLDDGVGLYLAWSSILDSYFLGRYVVSGMDRWLEAYAGIRARHPVFPTPEIEVRVHSMLLALLHAAPQHPELPAWAGSARKLVETGAGGLHGVFLACALMNYYIWAGDLNGAAVVMKLVKTRFVDITGMPLLSQMFDTYCAMFHWFTGNEQDCLQTVRIGLDRANASGVHAFDFLLLTQGICGSLLSGDLRQTLEFFEGVRSVLRSDHYLDTSLYYFQAGLVKAQCREWLQAIDLFNLSIDYGRQAGTPFGEAIVRSALAKALFKTDRLDEAEAELTALRQTAQDIRSTTVECERLLVEADLCLASGQRSRGLAALEQGLALSRHAGGLVAGGWWGPEANARLYAVALDAEIEVPFVQGLIRRMKLTPPDPANVPEHWPWPLKISALGQFSLVRDGATLCFNGKVQQKPLELLMALIAYGGCEASQAKIADALWPEAEGNAGYRALITTLHRLRKLLDIPQAVLLADGRLSLDPRYVWVDTWAFERLLDGMAAADTAATPEQVFALYRGPFLNHVEAPWAIAWRERLRARHRSYVLSLGRVLETAGQGQDAIGLYQKSIATDATVEAFHQAQIRCHIQQGQITEARAAYEHCRRVFASLGLALSRETQSLIHPYL